MTMDAAGEQSGTREVRVIGFDHLVLRCADVQASLGWYTEVLGLDGERVEQWRAGTVPFPSVRVSRDVIIDLVAADAPCTTRNLDHLCLVVEPGVVDAVAARPGGLRIVDGPSERFGAQGVGWSVYVLDPDDNVIELRSY